MLKNSLTIQKPASLTCDRTSEPAPVATVPAPLDIPLRIARKLSRTDGYSNGRMHGTDIVYKENRYAGTSICNFGTGIGASKPPGLA